MDRPVLLHLAAAGPSATSAVERLSTVAPSDVLAMGTVAEILDTVEHTPGCVGLLAVEDSFEGENTAVLDRLVFGTARVYVCEEVVVSERLDAFRVLSSEPADLRTAVADPRSVEHCHQFVRDNGLAVRLAGSAAEACRTVAGSNDLSLVAIAPRDVAERAGLVGVARSVDDVPDARTRFVLVGRSVAERTGMDRTALVLTQASDRSGNLERYLRAFAGNDVNLVSLHSRPLASTGSYCFLAVAEAHLHESRMAAVVAELWDAGAEVKVFGSYPIWDHEQVVAPFDEPLGSVGPLSTDQERAALLRSSSAAITGA